MADVIPDQLEQIKKGVTVYFNPFAFTIEQNNAFIAAGYEPMPMSVPSDREDWR